MKGWKTIGFLTAAMILAVSTLVVALFDSPAKHRPDAELGHVLKSRIPLAKGQTKTTTRIPVSPHTETASAKAKKSEANAKAVMDDREEEKLLDQVTKELLSALDEAVKRGDIKAIMALADKLRALNYGAVVGGKSGGGGLASVKQRILDALADAGVEGIGLVIDLLGDSDPVIAANATELLFKSLQDLTIGDVERAEIVAAAAEEMSDRFNIDRLFQEFGKIRHSYGVETLIKIWTSGTDQAKEALPRTIAAFTADTEITTPDQLKEWLENNPDTRYDNWYYGPRMGKNSVSLPKAKVDK